MLSESVSIEIVDNEAAFLEAISNMAIEQTESDRHYLSPTAVRSETRDSISLSVGLNF
jgi:hypothetical protein